MALVLDYPNYIEFSYFTPTTLHSYCVLDMLQQDDVKVGVIMLWQGVRDGFKGTLPQGEHLR